MLLRPSRLAGKPAGGGGGGYVAKAVHFDGATWLLSSSYAPDSSLFSFSGWFNMLGQQNTTNATGLIDLGPAANEYTSGPANFVPDTNFQFNFTMGNLAGSSTLFWTNAGYTTLLDSAWHHIFGCANCNFSQGNKLLKFVFDGVDITNVTGGNISDVGAAFQIPFSSLPLAHPDTTDDFANPQFVGDVADWWIAPGVFETDVTIFRDPMTGKPKNPSGFPSSAILFSGDRTGYPVNQGTGGAFTLTGALTNAASSPSD